MPKLSTSQIDVSHEYVTSKLNQYARNAIIPFTKYTMPEYEISWHHRITGRYLDKFIRKKIRKLMIYEPPRHGKSELTSRRAPALIFGKFPSAQIIAATYGTTLASRMNRDVQRIMLSPKYKELFPATRLMETDSPAGSGTYVRNSTMFEIIGTKGAYICTGIGGAITGMGGDYLLIDDPVKNQEEADSEASRENAWEWYTSTAFPRLEKGGSVLLTMTRWHEDDLAGRILKNEPGDWTILSFPAVKEDDLNPLDERQIGDALWPGKYDNAALESIKKSVGSRVWSALYQQRPSPEQGSVVQRGWWKYYTERPAEFDCIIQTWDLTFKEGKSNDFVAGQVWGRVGANKYLLDQFRARVGFTTTLQAFIGMSAKWPDCSAKLVEDAANGAALVDTLRKTISGIIPIRPRGNKLVRAQAVSPQIEAGNVYLPDPSIAPWIHDYVEEWASFPNGMHDDQVDATSQGLSYLTSTEITDLDIVSVTGSSYWNL